MSYEMPDREEYEDASQLIASLITELNKPNGLYAWLVQYGEKYSLTRYVALSITFCQSENGLPDPIVCNKLVETQEKLLSLHHLWCCFWNTYERIQDDVNWPSSVERHPMLAHLNSTMKPGLIFVSTAWKILVKIRSTNPALDPWVLSLTAFSLLLKTMISHPARFQEWESFCFTQFRESVDAYLMEKLYQSSHRFWECPLDPPTGIAPEVITSLVNTISATQIHIISNESHPTNQSSSSDRIIAWFQAHESNTENLNPMMLMTEYAKYLKNRKGLNPFVFLAKPSDDLLSYHQLMNEMKERSRQASLPAAPASQGSAKAFVDVSVVATDLTVERPKQNSLTTTSKAASMEEGKNSCDEGEKHDVELNDEAKDDDSMLVEEARKRKMIESLIIDVIKPNGLHTWLLRFDESNSLAHFVALSRRFCQEEGADVSPSVLQKLDATQEQLDALHNLWCCFWNTYERIQDDDLWKEAVQGHLFLARLDKTTKADMKFVAIAWKVVVKVRNNNSTLNPWVMSLVAFSLLLKAMKSHPASFQQWEQLCSLRFRDSIDAFLLGKLYQSSRRCKDFPLDPPPSFTADGISSLVNIIVSLQVHVTNKNTPSASSLDESFVKWFQKYENNTDNLNPIILMTEYARFIEKGKGLNPFIFLRKPAGRFLPESSKTTSSQESTGATIPLSRTGLPVARATQESMKAATSVPVVASDSPALKETTPNNNSSISRGESTTTKQAPSLPKAQLQEREQESSDEGSPHDVTIVLNDDNGDDGSEQQHDENKAVDRNHDKRPANDSELKSPEPKKQKLNYDDSRSQRLATAMALVVKELNIINQDSPDLSSKSHSLSDAMDLTEWTVSLLIVDHVAPSNKLSRYLNDGSLPQHWTKELIPTLNRTLLRFSQENLVDKATRTAPVSVTKSDGVVQIHGTVTDDKLMSKAVILLYYHALEAILTSESDRLKVTSHPQIVLYSVFHKALLACCMWCVTKAIGVTQKLRASPCLQALSIQSTLRVCDSNPYDFLKVSESFVRVLCLGRSDLRLGSPLPQKIPRLLHRDLQSMEVVILDSLLWSTSILNGTAGSLPEQIEDFMSKSDDELTFWPVETLAPTLREEVPESKDVTYPTPEHDDFAEYRCVNFLIRSVVKLSFSRFEDICGLLQVPVEYPVVTHAWVCFRHLLRHHVYVLFDRHMDQWILCCLYGVAKALSYPLTFCQIIEAYIKSRGPIVGDVTCQHILRYIRMDTTSHDLTTGDIIALYNHVWVPTMKPYMLKSVSLKESAKKVEELLHMKEQTKIAA